MFTCSKYIKNIIVSRFPSSSSYSLSAASSAFSFFSCSLPSPLFSRPHSSPASPSYLSFVCSPQMFVNIANVLPHSCPNRSSRRPDINQASSNTSTKGVEQLLWASFGASGEFRRNLKGLGAPARRCWAEIVANVSQFHEQHSETHYDRK